MSENTADITGAIAALSSVLESLEQRQASLVAQGSAAKQRRRERLDEHVAALLPDISGATMKRLKHEAPAFAADRKVEATFARHKKILWLFKPSGYDESLALLQAQLKHYSERQGVVSDEDQTLQRLESEKSALATQQSKVLEMLRLMEKARRTNTPIPLEAVSSFNSLAQRGRNLGSSGIYRPPFGVRRFAGTQGNPVRASLESDEDLWLWMTTDISTSFRALMLSSLAQRHDTDSAPQTPAPFAPGNGAFGGAGATEEFMPVVTHASSSAEPEPIATDDSLGAFS